jgi:hypothetical protein
MIRPDHDLIDIFDTEIRVMKSVHAIHAWQRGIGVQQQDRMVVVRAIGS